MNHATAVAGSIAATMIGSAGVALTITYAVLLCRAVYRILDRIGRRQ